MNCRTQLPVFHDNELSILPKTENKNMSLESPSDLFFNLSDDIYNKRWFERRFREFNKSMEGSMISTDLFPLLSTEEDQLLSMINEMSLDEKLGQLFILDLQDKVMDSYYTEINDDIKKLLKNFQPGGVILFSGNIYSNQQVEKFISDLQSSSRIPLFVAVDQEGGRVSRLNSSSKMKVIKIPSQMILGSIGDPDLSWEIGKIIGEELNKLGFNMDFAPVADINSNPDNPVLGDRAFSENSDTVSRMIQPFIQGLQESGICSIVKHFPGYGASLTDPHSGEVSVDLSLAEMQGREFQPFYAGVAQGAAGIMTAHIKTPEIIDTNGLPATLSSFFIKDIIRNEMGFSGLVISDSFSMAAIRNYWSPLDSAVSFIAAGGDIILRPSDAEAAMEGLLQSLKSGKLTEERINKSVLRILAAKLRFGFFSGYIEPDSFTLAEQQSIVDEITRRYESQKKSR